MIMVGCRYEMICSSEQRAEAIGDNASAGSSAERASLLDGSDFRLMNDVMACMVMRRDKKTGISESVLLLIGPSCCEGGAG